MFSCSHRSILLSLGVWLLLMLFGKVECTSAVTPTSPSTVPGGEEPTSVTSSSLPLFGKSLTMTTQNETLTYVLGCTKALILQPNMTLSGRGVYGARVVNVGGDLSTDRLSVVPDTSNFPELSNSSSSSSSSSFTDPTNACPGLKVIQFATMSENGLILNGPAPPSLFESCLRRVYFTIITPEPGSGVQIQTFSRRILFEAWAAPNGLFSVSTPPTQIDVALPFAPCVA